MGTARRRIAAVFALGALLAPSCALAAFVVHLIVDPHHGERPDLAADLQASLHGHWHIAGTPAHDHVLVLASATAMVVRPLSLVFVGASQGAERTLALAPATARPRSVVRLGLGPPGPDRLPTILRI